MSIRNGNISGYSEWDTKYNRVLETISTSHKTAVKRSSSSVNNPKSSSLSKRFKTRRLILKKTAAASSTQKENGMLYIL